MPISSPNAHDDQRGYMHLYSRSNSSRIGYSMVQQRCHRKHLWLHASTVGSSNPVWFRLRGCFHCHQQDNSQYCPLWEEQQRDVRIQHTSRLPQKSTKLSSTDSTIKHQGFFSEADWKSKSCKRTLPCDWHTIHCQLQGNHSSQHNQKLPCHHPGHQLGRKNLWAIYFYNERKINKEDSTSNQWWLHWDPTRVCGQQ